MKYLFVGERRSDRAKEMGVRWSDGRLAAKQLFDALIKCGIDPKEHEFTNWFEGGKRKTREWPYLIVAMGKKVQRALTNEGIIHTAIVHPAARGTIRKKDNYARHIQRKLQCDL